MFSSPFDSSIAFISLASDPLNGLPEDGEDLPLRTASKKRKLEFALGRAAARRALKKLGVASPPPVPRGPAGEPLWPENIVGSITHSSTLAAAAVAFKSEHCAIGIDMESLQRPLAFDITGRIALPEELSWIQEDSELVKERTLTLFSAKETIYKAFFPLCKQQIGFKDFSLSWEEPQHGFCCQLLKDLPHHFKEGFTFSVGSQTQSDFILTDLVLKQTITSNPIRE